MLGEAVAIALGRMDIGFEMDKCRRRRTVIPSICTAESQTALITIWFFSISSPIGYSRMPVGCPQWPGPVLWRSRDGMKRRSWSMVPPLDFGPSSSD